MTARDEPVTLPDVEPKAIPAWIDQAMAVPAELLAYQRFVEQSPVDPGAYSFHEARPRFEARPQDHLVALPGLTSQRRKTEVGWFHADTNSFWPLRSLSLAQAEALRLCLDGSRCLPAVEAELALTSEQLDHVLARTFGRVVLAPNAVNELEQRLSSAELVRLPASPYTLVRSYWDNCCDADELAAAQFDALLSPQEFELTLRRLHSVLLLGASGRSFYRPASPIARRHIAPGRWYQLETRIEPGSPTSWLLEGPRVSAPRVGGDEYFSAIVNSVDDPEALASERAAVTLEGLNWGRLVRARARGDHSAGDWFVPPRPITSEHLVSLRQCLRAAAAAPAHEVAAELARWHYRFIRLHPFSCGNQSLAMLLANHVLRQASGRGIPHLMLDQFALRLLEPAYQRLFQRAVHAWQLPALAGGELASERIRLRAASDGLIAHLASQSEPLEQALTSPAAPAALLRDPY